MRRSFLRLVVSTVLVCWFFTILLGVAYMRQVSWVDDRARTDGVFLAHELLDAAPQASREARLSELRQHFSVDLTIVSMAQAQARLGRTIEPGQQIPHPVSLREQWYFLAFSDGSGVLAAGPVHAAIPPGFKPLGVLFALFFVPVVASLIALRVEWGIRKVERATEAFANGELSARADSDVGPSAELAASFNVMAERIERLVRSRNELIQAVSHELGSPLSRLRFHLELLEDHDHELERRERLDAMSDQLEQLDELVAELLVYIQSDESALDLCTFDPRQGLSDLVELALLERDARDARDIRLVVDDDVTLHADPRLFLRAIENLLRNAMAYAHGEVRLEVAGDDGLVRVSIHDDGPGIPVEARARVTAPFVRLHADRGRASGGAGLGLAIVHRIIRRHAGRLVIDDSPMGGALVSTYWPRG